MEDSTDKIFIIQPDGGFGEVARNPYESEDILQRLLEEHPELLAGETFEPGKDVRFLLVGREFGVPDSDSGSNRWALDHLFLDQDATPTFVEVKRSSDTQIRRKVVGQMLDYAANGQKYWPVDRMRSIAMDRLGGADQLAEAVLDLIGPDEETDPEERIERFWDEAASRLRSGRVRLVFVSDKIPPELRRILEFLNEQMPRIQVIGLELVQYQGEGLPQILVPRVVGQTEASRAAKTGSSGPRKKTDEPAFLAACPESARSFFTNLLSQARKRNLEIYWGQVGFSIRLRQEIHGDTTSFLYGYPPTDSMSPEPLFQAYLKAVSDPAEAERLRAAIQEAGPFRGGGRFTLGIPVTEETLEAATAGMEIMFEWEKQQRKGRNATSSTAAPPD